jgi:4-diphosphocytidyl-2-C-methyl-D-erythritol kinase
MPFEPSRERRVQIRRRRDRVEIHTPAKINLFFEVLGRRDDGFHEIETLMAPINLRDSLIMADDPTGQEPLVTARWCAGFANKHSRDAARPLSDDLGDLPLGNDNICMRAVRLLSERAGVRRGAKITLVKRIPSASGLGGGSSDAAAALVGGNLVWNLNWTPERLASLAAEIGSDVPFFLARGPAICRGRGEKVEPVVGATPLHLVLVRPPEGLSTASVYRACLPGNPRQAVDPLLSALRTGDLRTLCKKLFNRLTEPARKMSPWIDRLLSLLRLEGCAAVAMSGSGSSCFGICMSAAQATRLASRLRTRRDLVGQVWAVATQ